jgi:hypothetical protein
MAIMLYQHPAGAAHLEHGGVSPAAGAEISYAECHAHRTTAGYTVFSILSGCKRFYPKILQEYVCRLFRRQARAAAKSECFM